jgi:hypothetical protein
VQHAAVVDVRKIIDVIVALQAGEQIRQREDAVGVELDTLRPDGHRKVQLSARPQNTVQVFQPAQVTLVIEGIAVATQTKMFKGMQAGERVAVACQGGVKGLHEVSLQEANVGNVVAQGTNIDYVYRAEGRHVGYEAIDARANIHVEKWLIGKDSACHQQILVEIVSAKDPAVRRTIVEAGKSSSKWKIDFGGGLLSLQNLKVAIVTPQTSHGGGDFTGIDSYKQQITLKFFPKVSQGMFSRVVLDWINNEIRLQRVFTDR